MLFYFMQMYYKELTKAYKDLFDSTSAALTGEKDFRDNVVEQEKMMAEADGEEMSEEELDQVVNVRVQTSPYKSKVDENFQRLKKVMSNG